MKQHKRIMLGVLILITFNNVVGQEIRIDSPHNVFTNNTFIVNVSISALETIGAYFNLSFNSSIIEAFEVKEGEFIKQCALRTFSIIPPKINNSIGEIEFQNLCFPPQTLSGSGVIAEITFRAKSHGKSDLIFKNEYIFDKNGNPMPTTKKYDSWVLVDNCSIIPCPIGLECNTTSGQCYVLSTKPNLGYGCVSNTNSSTIFGCGDIVTESCTLNGNMKCSNTQHGLIIGNNNIMIDGNNFNITGNISGYGIYLENKNNVTVKNFKIYNFFIGIYLSSSHNVTLKTNEISNNKVGIFSNASNSTINNNIVCNNTELDFKSSNWLSSYGDNNTCDKANGWKDLSATTGGCKFSCLLNCIEFDLDNNANIDIFDVVIGLEHLFYGKPIYNEDCSGGSDNKIDLPDLFRLIAVLNSLY